MMKTAESMKTLSAVLLLASLAAHGSAMPLQPYMFGEDLAEREQGATVDNPQSQHQRGKRAPEPVVSDYATTVFGLRPSWRSLECESTFNCSPVSPQHCTDNNIIFFSPNAKSKYNTQGSACCLLIIHLYT